MEIMNEVKKVMLASVIATASIGVTTQVTAEEVKPLEPNSGGNRRQQLKKQLQKLMLHSLKQMWNRQTQSYKTRRRL